MHSNMACFVFKLSVEACWLYIVYFILSQQKLRIMLLIVQYRSKISEPPNALSTRGLEEVNALVLFR